MRKLAITLIATAFAFAAVGCESWGSGSSSNKTCCKKGNCNKNNNCNNNKPNNGRTKGCN